MTNTHPDRRLAAVLASDVVGFSAMMARDEAQTLRVLKEHRETIFDPAVSRHNGRIVKLMGDGALVEFLSVVDAVECALEIQTELQNHTEIVLRIGVNLGDVIVDGDDIYGNGVNIAARLEPLATPGGVCVSEIVKDSISARPGVEFSDGGEVQVKNIDRPIRTWHWLPNGQAPAAASPSASVSSTKSDTVSIAVLPFENRSGDPEQEYFSDGISEDIITDLSKVSGLLVIARNSSFAYKGKGAELNVIGRDLGVGRVVEGSVRRAGQRVRVSAQLVDIKSGAQLWGDRYDREMTDIFEVQDELTLNIVSALKVELAPGEKERITDSGTTSVEAHDHFMKARSLLFSTIQNGEKNKEVVRNCDLAIALDPNYGRCYATRAFAHLFDYYNNWTGDSDAAFQSAKANARRALELTPDDPHSLQAITATSRLEGNIAEGDAAAKKALSIDPSFAGAYLSLGINEVYSGRAQDAIGHLERGKRLDPGFAQQYVHFLGLAHMFLGNYETARTMFRERLMVARETDVGRLLMASVSGLLGETDEAKKYWDELMALDSDFNIDNHLGRLPFQVEADKELILDGLRRSGII